MTSERQNYCDREQYQFESTRNLFRELRGIGFERYLSQHANEIRMRLEVFEQNPLADVVVAAFNEQDYLPAAIDALSRQTIPIKIIVVDNGSSDATLAITSSLGLSVIPEPIQGIGSAKKAGILHTQTHCILICDADTAPVPTWAEAVGSKLANNYDELNAVYCPVLYHDNYSLDIAAYNLAALGAKFLRSKTANPHYQGNNCGYTGKVRDILINDDNPQAGDDGPIHKKIMTLGGHTEWVWSPRALAFTSARRLKQHGVANVFVRRAAHLITGNSDVAYYTIYDANERGV